MPPKDRQSKGLNPRRRQFVAEYLVDRNATQAAIRAGYSAKGAGQAAHKLLKNAEIQTAIAKGVDLILSQPLQEAERVLEELRRIAFSNIGDLFDEDGNLRKPNGLPAATGAVVRSFKTSERRLAGRIVVVHRIQLWDKIAALAILAKYHNLFADRVEHTAVVSVLPDVTKMSDAELRARLLERYHKIGKALGIEPPSTS